MKQIAIAMPLLLWTTLATAGSPTEVARLGLRGAKPSVLARLETTVFAGLGTSLQSELYAIDTSEPSQPFILWDLELSSTAFALQVAPGLVFAGVGDNHHELYVIGATTGEVLSTVDLRGGGNPVLLEWEGPSLLRVFTKKGPGPEISLVDVSDPAAPIITDEIETGQQTERSPIEDIPGYLTDEDRWQDVLKETRGGTIYWHVLTNVAQAEFRTIERRVVSFSDTNGDGRFTMGCLGDSNTVDQPRFPKWCHYLKEMIDDPFFDYVQFAEGGATANEQLRFDPDNDAFFHVAGALQYPPDVLVLAYGQNDIFQGYLQTEIVDVLLFHEQSASLGGVPQFLVSTIPRIGAGANRKIEETNAMIRETFQGRYFESYFGFTIEDDFSGDGYHFNETGQRKRASRAFDLIGQQ